MLTVHPRRLPTSSLDLLERAQDSLVEALASSTAGERYVAAHLSAVRAAAAVLSVRGRPQLRSARPRSVWQVLPAVAPELAEWAAFFAAGAVRRAAVEAGAEGAVTRRDADDLVRDGYRFLTAVRSALGLPRPDGPALTAVPTRSGPVRR